MRRSPVKRKNSRQSSSLQPLGASPSLELAAAPARKLAIAWSMFVVSAGIVISQPTSTYRAPAIAVSARPISRPWHSDRPGGFLSRPLNARHTRRPFDLFIWPRLEFQNHHPEDHAVRAFPGIYTGAHLNTFRIPSLVGRTSEAARRDADPARAGFGRISAPPQRVRGKVTALVTGLLFKLALAPILILVLFVGVLGSEGPVLRVTVFKAAIAPMIGASIIAMDHELDPPLITLMIGVGIPLSFLTLPAWWYLL